MKYCTKQSVTELRNNLRQNKKQYGFMGTINMENTLLKYIRSYRCAYLSKEYLDIPAIVIDCSQLQSIAMSNVSATFLR